MTPGLKFLTLSLFAVLFLTSSAAFAEEQKGVTKGGVVFNIAADRKVESIGGIVQPEPLDLYLKRLMDNLGERLTRLEEKVDGLREDVRLLRGSGVISPTGPGKKT